MMYVHKGVYHLKKDMMVPSASLIYTSLTNRTDQTILQPHSTAKLLSIIQELLFMISQAFTKLNRLVDSLTINPKTKWLLEQWKVTQNWYTTTGYDKIQSVFLETNFKELSIKDQEDLFAIISNHLNLTERTFRRITQSSSIEDLELVLNHLRELPFYLEEDLQMESYPVSPLEIVREPVMLANVMMSIPNQDSKQIEEDEYDIWF